jgi:hypothetical protein
MLFEPRQLGGEVTRGIARQGGHHGKVEDPSSYRSGGEKNPRPRIEPRDLGKDGRPYQLRNFDR